MADEPARYDSPPEPNDKYYVIAQQKPENGLTWDFIAGPYDSQDAAVSNKVYAVREYSARRNHPEWLEGADVSVVHTPMQIPTGLGAIEVAERSGEERQDARPEAGKALPSPAAIADDRDVVPAPEGANIADKPAQYESPPESIELARKLMREIKEALTTDADGKFPAKYADMDWDGMNMQDPQTAWQDMDMGQRYDLLRSALEEAIWSLEPSAKVGRLDDSQKLAQEFVQEDGRQATPDFRADVVAGLMAEMEAFSDEFSRQARTKEQKVLAAGFETFVGDAHKSIVYIAEASREYGQTMSSSPGAIADTRDDMPTPEEWRKLQDEWTHDYGLHRMEDRGVTPMQIPTGLGAIEAAERGGDALERPLDHAAEGGNGQGRTGEQQGKPLPSPGEIGEDRGGPDSPGPERGSERGR
jgi:hypothetical protein